MLPVKKHDRGANRDSTRQPSRADVAEHTFSYEMKTSLELCVDIGSPRAIAVWMLLRENTPESIAQYLSLPPPIQPCRWVRRSLFTESASFGKLVIATMVLSESQAFADDYLVSEVMTKNPNLNSGIDTVATAVKKFHEAEDLCHDTNERLYRASVSYDPMYLKILEMRSVIRTILGKLSLRKLSIAEQGFAFGPGATSKVSGSDVLLSRKYAGEQHVTPRLYPFVRSFMGPLWSSLPRTDVYVNDMSRTTTVPKNAKTDRLIAVEPHLNILVQKGIGGLLRDRLRLFGINLETQCWNQFLASKASDWDLATVDLSMASDTICHRLVKELLPWEWYQFLMLARTDFTVVDGNRVALSKFSSMGNGYTFELETLIFKAACDVVGSHKDLTSVYGDDIIVEKRCYSDLIDLLNFLGFKANDKKTFHEGVFFESCGTDWYQGRDVRPFFLRGVYNDATQCRLFIPNALRRYAHRRGLYHYCDSRFKKAWCSAKNRLTPLEKRTAIPDNSGDDGLVLNWDESAPCRRWSNHFHAWQGRVLPLRPCKSSRTDRNGSYVATLHAISRPGRLRSPWLGVMDSSQLSSENIRGKVRRKRRLEDQPTLGWANLGPWL